VWTLNFWWFRSKSASSMFVTARVSSSVKEHVTRICSPVLIKHLDQKFITVPFTCRNRPVDVKFTTDLDAVEISEVDLICSYVSCCLEISTSAMCLSVCACFRRIINDSLRTDVSLLYPPYMISLGIVLSIFTCCLVSVSAYVQSEVCVCVWLTV